MIWLFTSGISNHPPYPTRFCLERTGTYINPISRWKQQPAENTPLCDGTVFATPLWVHGCRWYIHFRQKKNFLAISYFAQRSRERFCLFYCPAINPRGNQIPIFSQEQKKPYDDISNVQHDSGPGILGGRFGSFRRVRGCATVVVSMGSRKKTYHCIKCIIAWCWWWCLFGARLRQGRRRQRSSTAPYWFFTCDNQGNDGIIDKDDGGPRGNWSVAAPSVWHAIVEKGERDAIEREKEKCKAFYMWLLQ